MSSGVSGVSPKNKVCECGHRHDGWEVCTKLHCGCRRYRPVEDDQLAIAAARKAASAPSSCEVVRWPEFLAFAKRLGIALELPFRDIIIDLKWDDVVVITQTYLADDIDQQNAKEYRPGCGDSGAK